MKEPYKIYKDVYQIGGPDISGSGDCSIYLIDTNSEKILIDSGAGQTFDKLVKNIKKLGIDLEKLSKVVATHGHIDHIGSLSNFKRKFDVEIIAHELDSERIEEGKNTCADLYGINYTPSEIDVKLSWEKESITFDQYNLNFLHIPGHTPGSIACYLNIEDKKVLFGQDILGPYNLPGSDPSKAIDSLKKLTSINADILCEGHYGIFQPNEEVDNFIKKQLEKLEK